MSDVIAAILAAEFGNNSNNVEMRHEFDPLNPPSAGDVVALRSNGKIAKLPSSIVASGPSNNFFTVEDPTNNTSQGWLITPAFFGVYNEAWTEYIIDLGNGLSMFPSRTHLDDIALMFTNGTEQAPIQPFATGINFSTNMQQSRAYLYPLEGTTNKFLIIGIDNSALQNIISVMIEVTSNSVRTIERKVLYTGAGTAKPHNLGVKRLTNNKLIVTMAADSAYRSLMVTVNSPTTTSPSTTVSNIVVMRTGHGYGNIYMQYLTTTTMAVIVPTSSDSHTAEAFRLTVSGNTLSSTSLGTQTASNVFASSTPARQAYHTEFISSTKFLLIVSHATSGGAYPLAVTISTSSWSLQLGGSFPNGSFNNETSRLYKMSEDTTYWYFFLSVMGGGESTARYMYGCRINKSTLANDRSDMISVALPGTGNLGWARVGNRVVLVQTATNVGTGTIAQYKIAALIVLRMDNFTYTPVLEVGANDKELVHYNRVSSNLVPDDSKTGNIRSIIVSQVSGRIRIVSQTNSTTGVGSGAYINYAVSDTNLSELLTLPLPGIPYGVLQTNGSVCLKGIAEVPANLVPATKITAKDFMDAIEVGTCLSNKQVLIKDYLF